MCLGRPGQIVEIVDEDLQRPKDRARLDTADRHAKIAVLGVQAARQTGRLTALPWGHLEHLPSAARCPCWEEKPLEEGSDKWHGGSLCSRHWRTRGAGPRGRGRREARDAVVAHPDSDKAAASWSLMPPMTCAPWS